MALYTKCAEILIMTTVIANLKNYLNACLRCKKYDEYKPEDQVSSVVAEWLKNRESYSDYYVYLAWFAMRELLLKKFNNTVRVSDVVKTFTGYYDMYAKMLNEVDYLSDKLWLCNLCKEDFVHIYKIVSVSKKLYEMYINMYGKPEFTSLLPDEISGSFNSEDYEDYDDDEYHHLKIMSMDIVLSKIITFLRTSLKHKKWYLNEYDTGYTINLYDFVLYICKCIDYSDVNVQKIWYSIKFIIKYENEIITKGHPKNDVQLFNEQHPKLYEAIGKDNCFCYGEVGSELLSYTEEFIGLIDDNITIDLPEVIEPIGNKTNDAIISATLDLSKELMDFLYDLSVVPEYGRYSSDDISDIKSAIYYLRRLILK